MSSSDPTKYFKKLIEENTENREEEQLEQYINDTLSSTISLKTVNQQVEEKEDNIILKESQEKSIAVQNKIIPLTTEINTAVQISKQHKGTGPGIIYGEDGKTVINFHQKCPPITFCEGFEAKKTVILVYPARGERFSEIHDADDEVTRNEFYVYFLAILIIQTILTFSFIFACDDDNVSTLKDFLKNDRTLYICALVMTAFLFILMMCFEAVNKKSPFNYLVIVLFTFCSAYLLGYMHALMGTHQALLFSLLGTLIILVAIGTLSWANSYDFTTWFNVSFSLLITSSAFYVIIQVYFSVTGRSFSLYWFHLIFIIIMCLSLLHHFQLLQGEGKYVMFTDEYILAAFVMYLHVIIIYINFHKLLQEAHK